MDELILKLNSGQSSQDIEDTIVAISAQDADSLQQHKNKITTTLTSLVDDNAKLNFEMNAKLRRRIKRLLSSLTATGTQTSASVNDEYDKKLDAQLDALAQSLQNSTSCEEIEKIMATIPMNDIQHNSPGLNKLHKQLNTLANNDNLEMNAKLRRRLKRSIESISKLTIPVIPVSSNNSTYAQDGGTGGYNYPTYTPPPMPDPVSMDETIRLLSSVQTLRDVEYAMNSYVSILAPAPAGEGGDVVKEDPGVVKKKKALRQVMVNVLLSSQRGEA